MRSCGITLADGSWIEEATSDYPDIEAQKGDLILEAYIDVPPMPGDNRNKNYTDLIYTNLVARWVIRQGVSYPESGWAGTIQNKPRPMRSNMYLNC